MKNTKLLWITRTAVFLALLIAAQFVTRSMGQYATGSLVNLILMATVLTAGLASGLTVAALSPILAFLLGIGPAVPQVIPGVVVGNAVIVLILWLFVEKLAKGKSTGKAIGIWISGVIVGAAAKFLTLWLIIVKLVLPMLTLKPKIVETLSAAFSYPQLITALIGGALAILIVPAVRRAIQK